MKIVLSGGMQGVAEYKSKFAQVAAAYRIHHEVFNPAEHLVGDPNTATSDEHKQALRRCVGEIAAADQVVALPGWQMSRGASLEVYVATQIGVPVVFLEKP